MSATLMEKPAHGQAGSDDRQEALTIVLDRWARRRLLAAAVFSAAVGAGLLSVPFVLEQYPLTPGYYMIAGISVVLLSILFYYLSPARFLRSDVCDAMCVTGASFTYDVVGSMAMNGNRCIYLPPEGNSDVRILLAVPEGGRKAADGAGPEAGPGAPEPGHALREISIVPPGYGLLEHSRQLGAVFTPGNLEDEMRDVLVNGLELAGRVKVRQEGNRLTVEMRNVAVHSMCRKLREKNAGVCESVGCPLCSFAACMVVEGTGRKAILDRVHARGKTVTLSIELV